MPLSCRFYEAKFPEINDVVVVTVKSIQDMGAYVSLNEYNDIQGMILMSELSRRRIRSVNKLIRIGREESVLVIRVDQDKGYIDLSKRRATPEEVVKCQERFAKAKTVNQILRHVAEQLHYDENKLEELFQKTAWHFDKKRGERAASFDVFKHSVTNPEVLDECGLDEDVKKLLLDNVQRRLMTQAVKIRADFRVSCFEYEGIDAIKRALRKGLELSTEDLPIKIKLIAHPLFVMTTQTLEKTAGIEKLNKILEVIKTAIEAEGGSFNIQDAARVVSMKDDIDLKKQMEELENANREVSGDDDDEDDDEDEDDDDEEESGEDGTVENGEA